MLHLLSFVLAALVASKALAAPIEASAAADAEHLPTAPEWSVSGSIAARQLPSGLPIVGGLGSLLGNLPRAVGDGNLELDNLNIPLPGDSAPALKMRQGGPLVPVAPSPPRLPLPLSFVPTDGAAATGTQEIGAGGGGGGGGGISFPAVLRRQFEGIPIVASAAVRPALAPGPVYMPPMDVGAEAGKGTIKASAASPALMTAAASL
ncbi:hypothetical protein BN946_scf184493.g1 [Trametes cinnabarina]|uniref:Uncharacterized protein n=1 Tax=Pycnoporus cinnabarinus TaxID=5643 RepID=A0A060STB4_PYCCI|nr:hypothetical protein BN946_scf184493.g1 [Trametes cinnabarina]